MPASSGEAAPYADSMTCALAMRSCPCCGSSGMMPSVVELACGPKFYFQVYFRVRVRACVLAMRSCP